MKPRMTPNPIDLTEFDVLHLAAAEVRLAFLEVIEDTTRAILRLVWEKA